MRKRLRLVGVPVATAVVVAAALPLLSSPGAQAARFTGGNLVVYRVGATGGPALNNAAAPVFLDEFEADGTPVQSIALPTAAVDGNQALTATGQSRSEGLISNSADGRFVALTGYGAAPGATGPGGISLTGSSPTSVPRVVGLIDGNGTADTSTKLATAAAPSIIRSAATNNGSRIWATGGNGGIVTAPFGSSTAIRIGGSATSNLNSLTFQGSQLFTSGILANRLAKVGTGAPATAATLGNVAGLPDNLLTYGYALADLTAAGYAGTSFDTLYLANASARGGTVDKYRFNGTSWAESGYIDVEGAFGLVADVEGDVVSLAVTTPKQLLSITDTTGGAATFTPDDPEVLATAAANTEYRGVALAPSAVTGPSVYLRTPVAATAIAAGTAIKVSALVDSPDGVGSVKVKLGTGAFVNATKGAGKVWTATVPTTGKAVGAATLTVSATDQAGSPATANVTRAVNIVAPKGNLAKGSYALNNKLITSKGKWASYKTAASPTKKGQKSATRNARKSAKVYGSQLSITFTRGTKAGKVKVIVDKKAYIYDLYAKKTANLTKTWKFKGALKSHSVSVTVLGTKNVKSKGNTVSLAVLKVK